MAFSKYTVTNAGRDMMLACMATGDFQIHSLVLGSGSYSGDMKDAQELANPEITFSAEELRITEGEGQIEIAARLTNEQLEADFSWREYGVYATDGESTVLYCYDNAGQEPIPITAAASGTAISSMIKVILKIDSAATVNISFAPEPEVSVDGSVTATGTKPVSGAAVYAFAGGGIPMPAAADAGKFLRVNDTGGYALSEVPEAEEASF